MEKIVKTLSEGGSFLVCMHVDPDGDTIGSASAICRMLEKAGKKFDLYCSNKVPDVYRFLKYSGSIRSQIDKASRYDVLIALDCADSKRIPGFEELEKLCGIVVNIDHHSDNTKFGDINFVKERSSTGELIYDLMKKMKFAADKDIATSIFTAIVTDTRNFRYSNTTSRVFKIAAELVDAGADPHEISIEIYESKTRPEVRILGKALEKVEMLMDGQAAYTWLTRREIDSAGAIDEEMSSIADNIRALKGVDVAAFLKEMPDGKIKINLRSKQRNVQTIAKELGGGGHQRASGIVMEGPLDSAKDRLVKTIQDKWTQL